MSLLSACPSPALSSNHHDAAEDALSWLDDLATSPASHSTTSSLALPSSSSTHAANAGQNQSLENSSKDDDDASSSSQSSTELSLRRSKKSKIALDASQPLTAKGRPRARVYVACHQCRNRKIRCDGAKPACFNCQRRDSTIEKCNYDPAPKRRGQDKVPGSRTRSVVGQRAPRRSQTHRDGVSDADGYGFDRPSGPGDQRPNFRWRYIRAPHTNFGEIISGFDPSSFDVSATESYQLPPPPPADEDEDDNEETEGPVTQPNMRFARETWWDALLTLYVSYDSGRGVGELALSTDQRLDTTQHIFDDLRAVLRTSVYWASFLHLPRFFATVLEAENRTAIQPSLFLSMLAVGAHVQSSELKGGQKGRERALKLMEQAHAALQASLNSNWVDVGLVQAAWFMTYYEMQAHPDHSWERARSAMLLLDSLIRLFSLTTLDADQPNSRYSLFATYMNTVSEAGSLTSALRDCPGANNDTLRGAKIRAVPVAESLPVKPSCPGSSITSAACGCGKYTLKEQWPTVSTLAPLWEATTMWPIKMSEGEIRKEESRRLVWSTMMLTAGHCSYAITVDASLHSSTDLFVKDYRNYALLFPGETLRHAGIVPVRQNSVWNLCLRAMLLWHTSVRARSSKSMTPRERSLLATNTWLEADAIEDLLKKHTCNLEGIMLHQTREFLFMSRMCVSQEFSRFAPEVPSNGIMAFYREKAEAWLRNQMWVTGWLWEELRTDPASELSNRPLLIYWFMSHIVCALILYNSDPTLIIALEASKVFAQPLEFLMRLWPCPDQRRKWQKIRFELVDACLKSGVDPPAATLPPTPTTRVNGPGPNSCPPPSSADTAGT